MLVYSKQWSWRARLIAVLQAGRGVNINPCIQHKSYKDAQSETEREADTKHRR